MSSEKFKATAHLPFESLEAEIGDSGYLQLQFIQLMNEYVLPSFRKKRHSKRYDLCLDVDLIQGHQLLGEARVD